MVVLRGLIAVGTAMVTVCLPMGGGTGAFPPSQRRSQPAAVVETTVEQTDEDVADEASTAPRTPVLKIGNYPRFLRGLSGRAGQMGGGTVHPKGGPVREVLLSFDDGPDLFGTAAALDALDRHGWKAIFFVNGRWLIGSRQLDLQRRELVRKVAAHGHLVANHTLTHRNLCREPMTVPEEIDTNSEIIAYATGVRPLLFRSPYGARCHSLDEALRERELIQVGWNLDPQEWKAADQDAVFSYVTRNLSRLSGRAILLLHDTHPAAVRALPRILDWIEQENERVAREGGVPIRVVDYSVFVPQRPPPPPIGLEPMLDRLVSSLSILPGVRWARTRAGLFE